MYLNTLDSVNPKCLFTRIRCNWSASWRSPVLRSPPQSGSTHCDQTDFPAWFNKFILNCGFDFSKLRSNSLKKIVQIISRLVIPTWCKDLVFFPPPLRWIQYGLYQLLPTLNSICLRHFCTQDKIIWECRGRLTFHCNCRVIFPFFGHREELPPLWLQNQIANRSRITYDQWWYIYS